ncbi:uncharacterized protein WCC33_016608 [Rhinophrynus dorsalis]
MVPCYFSDHRAIHLQGVLGKGFPPCPGSWKLNCALLEREEIVEELRGAYKMWKLDKVYFPTVAQWWEFMKVKFHSFFQAKGRCQECERRSELRRLQRKLHSLQDLQLFGWDVRKEVDETKEGQKRHFEEESRRIIFRSKVEYLEKGEKCNSFFFRKLHSAHTPLIELRDRDGLGTPSLRMHSLRLPSARKLRMRLASTLVVSPPPNLIRLSVEPLLLGSLIGWSWYLNGLPQA